MLSAMSDVRISVGNTRVRFPDLDPEVLSLSCDDHHLRSKAQFRPIAFLTAYDSPGRKLCSWLEELGAVVMIITDHDLPTEWIADRDGKLECLVIDESYTGGEKADSLAARFLLTAPSIPIVRLVNSSSRYGELIEDFSSSSNVIARLPISRVDLKIAVLRAIGGIPADVCFREVPIDEGLEGLRGSRHGLWGLRRTISSLLDRWR